MSDEIGDYKIYDRVGGDGFGDVFAVYKKCGTDKDAYILKTLVGEMITDNNILALQNEINILVELNQELKCPYIPKLYAADKFNYPKDGHSKKARPYYVINYFSRDNLYMYVEKFNNLRVTNKLKERHIKVIFKKILLGVQYCHKKSIYHLDLKPANIVFDKKFEPIIIDFGLSEKTKISKEFKYGANNYKCPEKWKKTEYLSEKADIFSLGAILFNLVTGFSGFRTSEKNDYFYQHIYNNDITNYWDLFKNHINFDLSKEFKDLYINMISLDPLKRPTIDQILKSEWMKEINQLDKKSEKELENEVKSIMNELYKEFKDVNIIIKIAEELEMNGHNTRSFENDENKIFNNYNLKPIKIPNDKIIFNNHIIIQGYLNPINFMNSIIYEIKKSYKDNKIYIRHSEEKLIFNIYFNDDEEDEENEEEKEENEENKESVMQIELFKYEDGRYLLEFLRIKGEFPEFYKNFLKIKDIISKMFSAK